MPLDESFYFPDPLEPPPTDPDEGVLHHPVFSLDYLKLVLGAVIQLRQLSNWEDTPDKEFVQGKIDSLVYLLSIDVWQDGLYLPLGVIWPDVHEPMKGNWARCNGMILNGDDWPEFYAAFPCMHISGPYTHSFQVPNIPNCVFYIKVSPEGVQY